MASVGLPDATWRMLPPATLSFCVGLVLPMPTLPTKEAIPPTEKPLVVLALSNVAPPTTSSLESVEVEVKPMSTWLVVVETRTPEPLK